MHPHKHTHTHTSVVLSPLLVLTAHQSPVVACLNILTSAISLKSLSIRSSCAVPSTQCKPRVRNPPTYIHTHLELTHSHILYTQMSTLCAHTHMLTPILHKPCYTHTHKPTMRIRCLYLPIMHIHAVGSPWIFNVLFTMTAPLPRAWEHPA